VRRVQIQNVYGVGYMLTTPEDEPTPE